MLHKLIVPFLLIALFVLSGCVGTIRGGGTLSLFQVEIGTVSSLYAIPRVSDK